MTISYLFVASLSFTFMFKELERYRRLAERKAREASRDVESKNKKSARWNSQKRKEKKKTKRKRRERIEKIVKPWLAFRLATYLRRLARTCVDLGRAQIWTQVDASCSQVICCYKNALTNSMREIYGFLWRELQTRRALGTTLDL